MIFSRFSLFFRVGGAIFVLRAGGIFLLTCGAPPPHIKKNGIRDESVQSVQAFPAVVVCCMPCLGFCSGTVADARAHAHWIDIMIEIRPRLSRFKCY